MKGRKHTVKLSTDERRQLTGYIRRHNSYRQLVLRAQIILKADEGGSYDEIAGKLSVGRSAVTRWVKRWNETAEFDGKHVITRLQDQPRSGRKETFTPEQKAKDPIRVLLKSLPQWQFHRNAYLLDPVIG